MKNDVKDEVIMGKKMYIYPSIRKTMKVWLRAKQTSLKQLQRDSFAALTSPLAS